MNSAFIYLLGYAGCGKRTVAQAIQERFDAILVDNHLINNVIFSLVDADGKTPLPEAVWDSVITVRRAALDVIRDVAKPGRSFIFTNELRKGQDRHDSFFQEIEALAAHRAANFLPVRLLVEPVELARRVVSGERAAMFKEIDDVAALSKIKDDVYLPRSGYYLNLDVTKLAPGDAAARILSALRGQEDTSRVAPPK